MVENVIRALRFASRVELAPDDDAAFGEGYLFAHLCNLIPARDIDNRGRDEHCADVAFAEYLFIDVHIVEVGFTEVYSIITPLLTLTR